jgi:hypothetical protein
MKTQSADLIGTSDIRKMTGIKSSVTIWRACRATPPRFPAPAGYVLGRRMWRRADVESWLEAELQKPSPLRDHLNGPTPVASDSRFPELATR